MPELRIGDRVRLRDDVKNGSFRRGEVGTVIGLAFFERFKVVKFDRDSRKLCLSSVYLQLIPAPVD